MPHLRLRFDWYSHAKEVPSQLIDELLSLWETIGWEEPFVRDAFHWLHCFAVSVIAVAVYEVQTDRFVGFARFVDGGMFGRIYDVAIVPEYRGKGVGTQLMKELLVAIKNLEGPFLTITLDRWDEYCEGQAEVPNNLAFYKRLGFAESDTEMFHEDWGHP